VEEATWIKMNEGEVADVLSSLGGPWADFHELGMEFGDDWLRPVRLLLEATLASVICVTRGANGCLVQTSSESVDLPGIPVRVADTVGCGDAFTAALVTQSLEGKSLTRAARFANAYAAVVASKPGGTPHVERADVERLL
jgi:fructokinase